MLQWRVAESHTVLLPRRIEEVQRCATVGQKTTVEPLHQEAARGNRRRIERLLLCRAACACARNTPPIHVDRLTVRVIELDPFLLPC
jgi:hypothetical protein